MQAHIFCTEHILYLVVTVLLSAIAIVLIKIHCKSLKAQKVAVKISGAVLLTFLICNRVACYLDTEHYFFPVSLCGNLSLVFSLFLLFGKPDNAGFHFIVLPAIVFCACANVYPTYITQDPSFWFPATIFGLLHHSVSIYAGVLLLVLRWVNLGTKHLLAFPVGYGAFILYGIFNITVLGYEDSMNIYTPLITLGSLELNWFVIGITATVVIWAVNLAADAIEKRGGCAICVCWRKARQKLKQTFFGDAK